MIYRVPGHDVQLATKAANDCRTRLIAHDLWPKTSPQEARANYYANFNARKYLLRDT